MSPTNRQWDVSAVGIDRAMQETHTCGRPAKMVRGQLVCLIYSQFLLVHGQIVIGR